jgi:hypothetical protein
MPRKTRALVATLRDLAERNGSDVTCAVVETLDLKRTAAEQADLRRVVGTQALSP